MFINNTDDGVETKKYCNSITKFSIWFERIITNNTI